MSIDNFDSTSSPLWSMSWTRFLNVSSREIEQSFLDQCPPFIAISHAWSESLFPPNVTFNLHPGAKAILALVAENFPHIDYCWIDTLCIDQNDEDDKRRQIPLMSEIYGKADVVAIVLAIPLGLTQAAVDEMSEGMTEVLEMYREESWPEHGIRWQTGLHRKRIIQAMNCLEIFTRSPWANRVWTLQEFILGKAQIWIGSDLVPIRINEELFLALPDICETLSIVECIGGKYAPLYRYYRGMVGASMGTIDRTRVMELLGNRTASVPVDEIFGTMAASGVIIDPNNIGSKEMAWNTWCEEAVRIGHIRWALLPPVIARPGVSEPSQPRNCIFPTCSERHLASSSSCLDSVKPLGTVKVEDGTVWLDGRFAGLCDIRQKLGRIHEHPIGMVHRDITLILFAQNYWTRAKRVAAAFGGGRYSRNKLLIIAQILKHNYYRAQSAVMFHREESFRPRFWNAHYKFIWSDFMNLQSTHMMPVNDGIAYLAELRNTTSRADVVIIANDSILQQRQYIAVDFGAVNTSGRTMLTVLEPFINHTAASPSFHKIGVTLAMQRSEDPKTAHRFSGVPIQNPELHRFAIGGPACEGCKRDATTTATTTTNAAVTVDEISVLESREAKSVRSSVEKDLLMQMRRKIRRQQRALRPLARRRWARFRRER